MPALHTYDYAIIRVVPRVDRGGGAEQFLATRSELPGDFRVPGRPGGKHLGPQPGGGRQGERQREEGPALHGARICPEAMRPALPSS